MVVGIAGGKSIKEIAFELRISKKTVEYHWKIARDVIGERTVAGVTRWAIWTGLIDMNGRERISAGRPGSSQATSVFNQGHYDRDMMFLLAMRDRTSSEPQQRATHGNAWVWKTIAKCR